MHLVRVPTLLALLAALSVPAAQAADADLKQPVPKVERRKPAPMPPGSEQVVEFTTWKSALLVNDVVGQMETSGLFCSNARPMTYTKKWDEWLVQNLTKRFKEQAVLLGFTQAEATRSVFDDKGANGADFRLGATLVALDYRVCSDSRDTKGDAYAKIKWELFSTRRQKVVYTATIDASYSTSSSMPAVEFDGHFLGAVVDNLLSDPRLVSAIRSGGATEDAAAKAYAPLELAVGPVISGGVSKAAPALLTAAVLIESGIGSGTAFYVSRDGYLLTNQHVVADAKFVRVKLSGGRSMVGEVLRVDKVRDVALLRTDPVGFDVLQVRRGSARVGEEVHAIGSPFGELLTGTVTRGILSANRVIDGIGYLQSDVAINPGNSGGPLLDSDGRILGIAQLAIAAQGINLFIPIDDALDKLGLTLNASAGTQAK